jgi:hypothetical protein
MFRRSLVGLGALLGGFHLWLLADQAWSGQLSQPGVGVRWVLALALGVGLVSLTRRRGQLVGRQTVALWLLVALLHGPAFANDHDGFATPALPEAALVLVQVASAISAVGLALVALATFTPRAIDAAGLALASLPAPANRRSAPRTSAFLPRPPPRG